MKKILKVVLLMLLIVTSAFIFKGMNKVDAATAIKAGKWYQAQVRQKTGIQYNYKVPSSGYFYYEIVPEEVYYKDEDTEGQYIEDKFSQDLYIETGLGESAEDISNFRGGINVDNVWKKYKSNKYSIKPGKKVILFFGQNMDARFTMKFKFRVLYKKVKNFEKENNNSLKKANVIKKGKTYTGVLMGWEDDWFTFKSTKTKKYKIKVKLTEDTANEGINVGICRGKGYIGRKSVHKKNGWKTVFSGKIKKGQTVSVSLHKDNKKSAMYKIKAQ